MGEISTGHVALILTALGLMVPVLSALSIFLLQRLFSAGDKSGDRYDALQKSLSELTLQLANLRTELAQQEIARQKDLEARFASRETQALHEEALAFVRALTLEVHRRMYPEAAIHQPGGR